MEPTGWREYVLEAEEPAMSAMARCLAESLARHEIYGPWIDLEEGDKHSLAAVCEWLLMHFDLVEAALAEHSLAA